MKKYVLTGGSSSGKSSIILYLEHIYDEYIVRESAEDYIKLRQAEGCKEPWKDKDYQENIMKMQLRRNNRIPKGIDRVFMDREVPDGIAYSKDEDECRIVYKEAIKGQYDAVFLIEPIGRLDKTTFRRENYNEAVELGKKIKEIYRSLGYEPIEIPAMSLKERAKMIIDYVR